MPLDRALALVGVAMMLMLQPAAAQFGGMPGMPGSPGTGGGFGAPRQAPPPQCQQLLVLRDDMQKHASAIQAADKKKASATDACKLFKVFLAAEGKMLKAIEKDGPTCGVPPEVNGQMKAGHTRTEQIAKQVCDAAAMGPRPSGPTLSESLGAGLSVPRVDASKPGRGTFDTLTGNPLAR